MKCAKRKRKKKRFTVFRHLNVFSPSDKNTRALKIGRPGMRVHTLS